MVRKWTIQILLFFKIESERQIDKVLDEAARWSRC